MGIVVIVAVVVFCAYLAFRYAVVPGNDHGVTDEDEQWKKFEKKNTDYEREHPLHPVEVEDEGYRT